MTDAGQGGPVPRSKSVRQRMIAVLGALGAVAPLSIDLYLPALPVMQQHFGTTEGSIQATLSSFFFGMAFGQLLYGPISDAVGRRKPLLFGLGLYTLASLGCVLAPSADALILLRMLQALGGCAGVVISRAIVRDCYGPQEMARILSLMVLIMGVAPILAPLIGGFIFTRAGWQALFYSMAAFGLLLMVAITLFIPETRAGPRAPLSFRGAVHTYARLLQHRRFLSYAIAGGTAQAGMFSYIAASSFVFIQYYGVPVEHFGWVFGLNALGLITASQLNHRLLQHVPAERLLTHALRTYLAAGAVMLVMALTGVGGMFGVAVPLFIAISSLGFSFPNVTAAAMAPFGDRAGAAAAMLGTMQFTLAGIVSYLVGHVGSHTPVPMALAITLCGVIANLLLRRVVGVPLSKDSTADSTA